MAFWVGGTVDEVVVNHRARQFGLSKYGISRTLRVVLDLVTVTVDRGVEEQQRPRALHLEVTGADHPGIVHKVTEVLVQQQLNISTLETETRDAPMSGDVLFVARAALQATGDVDLEQLRAALERLADDLMVDVSLQEPSEPR